MWSQHHVSVACHSPTFASSSCLLCPALWQCLIWSNAASINKLLHAALLWRERWRHSHTHVAASLGCKLASAQAHARSNHAILAEPEAANAQQPGLQGAHAATEAAAPAASADASTKQQKKKSKKKRSRSADTATAGTPTAGQPTAPDSPIVDAHGLDHGLNAVQTPTQLAAITADKTHEHPIASANKLRPKKHKQHRADRNSSALQQQEHPAAAAATPTQVAPEAAEAEHRKKHKRRKTIGARADFPSLLAGLRLSRGTGTWRSPPCSTLMRPLSQSDRQRLSACGSLAFNNMCIVWSMPSLDT